MACLLQLPIERAVPGEPFLLLLLVVIGVTLLFGARIGLAGVGLSTLFSIPFFEPMGTLALARASDLLKIEVFAVVAAGCVVAFSSLTDALLSARGDLERANRGKSLLLRELAHGVANNFATVAALINTKSASISDPNAKLVLNEAIEQVMVMAHVHRRLRGGATDAVLDSRQFIDVLCDDLNVVARGRGLSVECHADSCLLPMDRAVLLGLIINELVTNAIKHAFPGRHSGSIHVSFEALEDVLKLCVRDEGVGLTSSRSSRDTGESQNLVKGLANELRGTLDIESTSSGSSFRVSIPVARRSGEVTLIG